MTYTDVVDEHEDGDVDHGASANRSINTLMTPGMLEFVDAQDGGSRSERARLIVGSFLIAGQGGDTATIESALEFARKTSSENRKVQTESRLVSWTKKVIWIPSSMFDDINEICILNDIRVSDFIRGAIACATQADPMRKSGTR